MNLDDVSTKSPHLPSLQLLTEWRWALMLKMKQLNKTGYAV